MYIKEFLGRLDHVSGPNGSGEYMARCPCHDDKTASLSVTVKPGQKDGRERIFFCCHAGCDNRRIMEALGVTARDLVADGTGIPAPGGRADLMAFDPEEVWTVDPAEFRSKGRNTVFGGETLTGRVKLTILGGRIVYNTL